MLLMMHVVRTAIAARLICPSPIPGGNMKQLSLLAAVLVVAACGQSPTAPAPVAPPSTAVVTVVAFLPGPPPPSGAPETRDDCKNGGWELFLDYGFVNQGQCIRFVETGVNNHPVTP